MGKKELTHSCDQNPHDDLEIRYEKFNQEEWGWVLSLWWSASPTDINEGYAKEVGEQMCSHHLLISHCPFCGEHLEAREQGTWHAP